MAAASGSLTAARLPSLPRGSRSDLRLHTRLQNFRGRATPTDRALEGALRSSDNVWFAYLGLLLHEPLREGWLGAGIADDDRRGEAWPVHTLARNAGFDARLDLGFGVTGRAGRRWRPTRTLLLRPERWGRTTSAPRPSVSPGSSRQSRPTDPAPSPPWSLVASPPLASASCLAPARPA